MAQPYSYPEVVKWGQKFTPFEIIQKDVEGNLPKILNKPAAEITTIVVVGAWHGDEVVSFLRLPNANIYCFEPDASSFAYLSNRFRGVDRVRCYPYACGPSNDTRTFYATDREGNGSLLRPMANFGLDVSEKTTRTVRLDTLPDVQNRHIDLIWADVQGYELEVLKGAQLLLPKCDALFLEVGEDRHYEQATTYKTLQDYLAENGFTVAAEGIVEGYSGNILFMPGQYDRSKIFSNIPGRVVSSMRKEYWRRLSSNLGVIDILPNSLKLQIKKLIKW